MYTLKRMLRSPLLSLGLLLFAAAVTVVLCGLEAGSETARSTYRDIYRSIDVVCTLTNEAGNRTDGLWIDVDDIDQFTGARQTRPGLLKPFVRQVDIKGSTEFCIGADTYYLLGITSPPIETRLLPENGCTITWLEGYDDSVFSGGQAVCLIPEALWKDGECTEMEITLKLRRTTVTVTLTTAGTYRSDTEDRIYCPWAVYRDLYDANGEFFHADSLRMVLDDNDRLEEFRAAARTLYPAPDPNAVESYQLALDINDTQLVQAARSLENNLRTNRIAARIILVLSVCIGFLSGFLLIHSRKREIFLQRVLGTPVARIVLGFLLEQVSVVAVGIAAGGAWFRWQPPGQLALFALIFTVGLISALAVFLRKDLMTTMKEDG